MRSIVTRGMLTLVVLAGGGNLAFGTLATTVDPGAITSAQISAGESLGWRFFVDEPIAITGLGLYDAGDDGLASTHVLGLWRLKKEGGLVLERWVSLTGTGDLQEGHQVFATLAQPLTIFPDPVPALVNGTPNYERWLVGVWSPSGSTDALILTPQSAATFTADAAGVITFQNYTEKMWTAAPDTTLGAVTSASQNWYPWPATGNGASYGVDFQYTVIPAPSALVLAVLGCGCVRWRLRHQPASPTPGA
jgi:hypothetical protein